MKSKHYLHGGDLDAAAELYHLDRNMIWDFSGNINPLGTSPLAKEKMTTHIDQISTYPDRSYTSLRKTLGHYCKVSHDTIMVGNGTSELISVIIHSLHPKKALTLAPTYSEYEREIQMIGGALSYYTLDATQDFGLNLADFFQALSEDIDLLILCNPNNPTSTALTTSELTQILDFCKQLGIFVMVDETYIEFCDHPATFSAVSLTPHTPNLLVLRGISKFFSAPGLRFGYAICSNLDLLTQLKEKQNPWSVNMLATIGVEAMFQDESYIKLTHELFVTERKRIMDELSTWPMIHVYTPEANFVLIKLLNPSLTGFEVMDTLLKQNMLIRDASSFPGLDETYIRFCFLAPHQNDRLLQSLKNILIP